MGWVSHFWSAHKLLRIFNVQCKFVMIDRNRILLMLKLGVSNQNQTVDFFFGYLNRVNEIELIFKISSDWWVQQHTWNILRSNSKERILHHQIVFRKHYIGLKNKLSISLRAIIKLHFSTPTNNFESVTCNEN